MFISSDFYFPSYEVIDKFSKGILVARVLRLWSGPLRGARKNSSGKKAPEKIVPQQITLRKYAGSN